MIIKTLLFILYFATALSTILSIRMLAYEIMSAKYHSIAAWLTDYFHFIFYLPTAILWAICLII